MKSETEEEFYERRAIERAANLLREAQQKDALGKILRIGDMVHKIEHKRTISKSRPNWALSELIKE